MAEVIVHALVAAAVQHYLDEGKESDSAIRFVASVNPSWAADLETFRYSTRRR